MSSIGEEVLEMLDKVSTLPRESVHLHPLGYATLDVDSIMMQDTFQEFSKPL